MAFVKFLQGSFDAFKNLATKDNNTLYFITGENNANTASLYLGSRLIGSSDLASLNDVLISEVGNRDVMLYDAAAGVWKNASFDSLVSEIESAIDNLEAGLANYYTKTEVDGFVTTINGEIDKKADAETVEAALALKAVKADVDAALALKADASALTTAVSNLEGAIALKANSADVYNKEQIDGMVDGLEADIAEKADASAVYTKGEVDTALGLKANAADVYTKGEVDTKVSNLQGAIDNVYTKSEVYTKDEVDSEINEAVVAAAHLKRTIVDSIEAIPVDAADALQYIYMVSTGNPTEDDKYDEYLVIETEDGRKVERVGSWEIDLTPYAKAADVATSVGNLEDAIDGVAGDVEELAGVVALKANTADVYAKTETYSSTEVDTKIADALQTATGGESAAAVKAALEAYKTANDTRVGNVETEVDALQEAVEGLEKGAEVNVIDSVEETEFTLVDRHLGIKAVAASKITDLDKHSVLVALNESVAANTTAIGENKTAVENVLDQLNSYVTNEVYEARVKAIETQLTWGTLA